MRSVAALAVAASLLSGCLSYTLGAEHPKLKSAAIAGAVEAAVIAGVALIPVGPEDDRYSYPAKLALWSVVFVPVDAIVGALIHFDDT